MSVEDDFDYDWLSIDEAAALAGVSRRRLAVWRRDGCGPPFVRHRGRVFYESADLAAWVKALPTIGGDAPARIH